MPTFEGEDCRGLLKMISSQSRAGQALRKFTDAKGRDGISIPGRNETDKVMTKSKTPEHPRRSGV
jgi:hypothetical protein